MWYKNVGTSFVKKAVGVECRRRENRGAYGADGVGAKGGGVPSHWGRGLVMVVCPLPRNFGFF